MSLLSLPDSLKLPLNLTLRQDKDGGLDKWTVDNLLRGELVAVTFASIKNRRTKHWALCVGCEGTTSCRDTRGLTRFGCSDPSDLNPAFKLQIVGFECHHRPRQSWWKSCC